MNVTWLEVTSLKKNKKAFAFLYVSWRTLITSVSFNHQSEVSNWGQNSADDEMFLERKGIKEQKTEYPVISVFFHILFFYFFKWKAHKACMRMSTLNTKCCTYVTFVSVCAVTQCMPTTAWERNLQHSKHKHSHGNKFTPWHYLERPQPWASSIFSLQL